MNKTRLSNFKSLAHSFVATALAMATITACTTACSGPSSSAPGPELAGTSSGGGSFGDESSMKLLNWSKELTAASIRRANPAIFKNLPKGWTQERLAKLIETVKSEPRTEASRYDRELMFDYRSPKTGEPYLVATALFFRAHAAIPVNSTYQSAHEPYIREIRTKLLHEAAHVMGIGLSETSDIKARAFAVYMTSVILTKNNILCETMTVPKSYPGSIEDLAPIAGNTVATAETVTPESAEPKPSYLWAINRPTGFGIQSLKSPRFQSWTPSWLKEMRQGKTVSHGSFALFASMTDDGSFENAEYQRWYRSPDQFRRSKDKMSAQYYSGYTISTDSKDRIVLSGSEEFTMVNNKGNRPQRELCKFEEKIETPRLANGAFTAKVVHTDSCELYGESESRFEMACTETYEAIENMDEFFGEKLEFSNPYLIDWLRLEGTL